MWQAEFFEQIPKAWGGVISFRIAIQIRDCTIDQRQTQLDFHVWFTKGKPLMKK